jgi:hypothetical protein
MKQYAKAIASFVVAYLGILITTLQAGAKINDPTTYLIPLVGAISSLYVVYRVPNTTTIQ